MRPEKIYNPGSQVELNLENCPCTRASEPASTLELTSEGVFKALHQLSSLAPLTPALFSFIVSGVQIKPQEEGQKSLPAGKLIRIWKIMLQITACFGDLPHNLRQNALDSIQALHYSDYGRLR